MKRNVLEYLEETLRRRGDAVAFSDGAAHCSFEELNRRARAVGSSLLPYGRRKPAAVLMDRRPDTVAAFLGVLYSGNFYIPLEKEMSAGRIALILDEAKPQVLICDETTADNIAEYGYKGPVLRIKEIIGAAVDEAGLAEARAAAIDADPVYVVFTSGSTGVPKGVVANHRNLIDYIEALSETLRIDEDTVFGMQVPLYVDACLKEIWCTIKHGSRTVLLPRKLFATPVKLVEFMNEQGVNTVCWVVSALTIISGLNVLDRIVPELRTIAFGSEVFPSKQFERWRKALPDARFINLYGPTECTGMSCFYEVGKDFPADAPIPIGKPFPNTEIFLADESGRLVTDPNVRGEIYIRGAGVTPGYYNSFERTAEAFVQNPINSAYPETVYRTGDVAAYNDLGELIFIARKDWQIKHMGYRIELAEIEALALRRDEVRAACCVYVREKDRIVLFYSGSDSENELSAHMRRTLPRYMEPAKYIRLEALPCTPNGKADRALMLNRASEM
jgi:amino acid adenylation domain-containing protein